MFSVPPYTHALKLVKQICTQNGSDTYFRTQIIGKRFDRAIAHVVHRMGCSYVCGMKRPWNRRGSQRRGTRKAVGSMKKQNPQSTGLTKRMDAPTRWIHGTAEPPIPLVVDHQHAKPNVNGLHEFLVVGVIPLTLRSCKPLWGHGRGVTQIIIGKDSGVEGSSGHVSSASRSNQKRTKMHKPKPHGAGDVRSGPY